MAGEPSQPKKTKGRQKIEMKRIENEDDRLITFSKRRSGIYKKASELVTLTGAEVAFLVYSPAGKPFSFAHPSMEAVANRFLGKEPSDANTATQSLIEAHRLMRIDELNQQHNELIRQLELEKEKEKHLKVKHREIKPDDEKKAWWDTPIEELNVQELLQMEAACMEIKTNLINKLKERTNNGASSSSAAAVVGGGGAGADQPPAGNYQYPTPMFNPFASANDIDQDNAPSVFPPGFDYGNGQI